MPVTGTRLSCRRIAAFCGQTAPHPVAEPFHRYPILHGSTFAATIAGIHSDKPRACHSGVSCQASKKVNIYRCNTVWYLLHIIPYRRLLRVPTGKVQMMYLHHRVCLLQPERAPFVMIIKHKCVTHSYIRPGRTLAASIRNRYAG